MSNAGNGKPKAVGAAEKPADLTCGLIMPISLLDGCTADHWAEVKTIITEAVESISSPRFVTRLVSDADEIGVIQKRIVQNVYNSTIVVCDVSGKNPNVMFELGLRLAFDKPTVIIKDDKTDYSFDTGVIEHIGYPRDLRFGRIVDFKKKLAEKISSTYKASLEDPKHSPFLKSFGQFHVASLTQSEASPDKVMLEMLTDMQRDIQILRRRDRDRLFRPDIRPQSLIASKVAEVCQRRDIRPEVAVLDDNAVGEIAKTVLLELPIQSVNLDDVRVALNEMKGSSAKP
ncbi:MAG: RNA helicase [Bryobacteraceae bacterium]|jgi:hypothetical protein